MNPYPTIPRISVTMVSEGVDGLSFDSHTTGQKPMPLKIDTTHTQNAEWYGESESSSSSDSSESDEDNEHEGDIAPPHWRQQKLYRSTNPLPISSHIAPPKSRKPRSPFSPLRNSFTAPADEEHASLPSDSSLPEDKKGLDKERADDLLRASRERRAKLMAGMRIRTSPISPPATRVISFNSGAISARRAMDLRKEITLKVHAAKHEERRQTFLARLLASPSSSPTTLTTPATPPESPAEFHYTLPSPGLTSPLALFEALSVSSNPARKGREEGSASKRGENAFQRIERVNWAHEAKNPTAVECEPGSPPAPVKVGCAGGMSVGTDVVPMMRAPRAQRKAQDRLPIGVGRLQTANSGLHTKKLATPASSTPVNMPSRNRMAPSLHSTDSAAASVNHNRECATVVVPPRRSASLLRRAVAGPGTRGDCTKAATITASSPATQSRPRHPPSLNEITERLHASKAVADTKHANPMTACRRSNLTPLFVRATPVTTGDQRSTARAAAFPDFLREGQRQRVGKSTAGNADASKSGGAAAAVPATGKDDSVLALPPARPKSVDAALQERVLRGNAMMARLSLGHRRRKSESGMQDAKLNVRPAPAGRAGNGWF